MPKPADLGTFQAETRAEWRAWLEEHHDASPGVWLVYFKKSTGRSRVGYDEAVEEALCFGWIDSRPNKLDDERAKQLFTPRKPRSPWSALNKRRVAKLIEEGRMTPAGMAKVDAAKANGDWEVYDAIESLTVPDDLAAALAAAPKAKGGFAAFSPSQTKQLLWWVASAKRPATREKRIAQLVEEAAHSRNPLDWRARQTERRRS